LRRWEVCARIHTCTHGSERETERKRKEESDKTGTVTHICNPNTWEAEAGGWRIQGQPGLHGETLSEGKERRKEVKKRKRFWTTLPTVVPSHPTSFINFIF
jgi:hypothetical protein